MSPLLGVNFMQTSRDQTKCPKDCSVTTAETAVLLSLCFFPLFLRGQCSLNSLWTVAMWSFHKARSSSVNGCVLNRGGGESGFFPGIVSKRFTVAWHSVIFMPEKKLMPQETIFWLSQPEQLSTYVKSYLSGEECWESREKVITQWMNYPLWMISDKGFKGIGPKDSGRKCILINYYLVSFEQIHRTAGGSDTWLSICCWNQMCKITLL